MTSAHSLRLKAPALAVLTSVCLLSASCTQGPGVETGRILQSAPPRVAPATSIQQRLEDLPPPPQPIVVAVYSFVDQTGQYKPSEEVQTLSSAVTQGATSMLIETLQVAGDRRWFTVVERERLDNLLRERQVISESRRIYLGEEEINPDALPPLLFAGILLEGGVIGFDTNLQTGGAGARFLGIGGNTQYRVDDVTVYLRAVSVGSGEVLNSVVAKKTIASIATRADVFRFIDFQELLEVEGGFTTNEPTQFALRQAIEKAVHDLVVEGSKLGMWNFEDRATGAAAAAALERENAAARAIGPPAEEPQTPAADTGDERREPSADVIDASGEAPDRPRTVPPEGAERPAEAGPGDRASEPDAGLDAPAPPADQPVGPDRDLSAGMSAVGAQPNVGSMPDGPRRSRRGYSEASRVGNTKDENDVVGRIGLGDNGGHRLVATVADHVVADRPAQPEQPG